MKEEQKTGSERFLEWMWSKGPIGKLLTILLLIGCVVLLYHYVVQSWPDTIPSGCPAGDTRGC